MAETDGRPYEIERYEEETRMSTISSTSTLSRQLWEARRDGRRIRVGDEERPGDEATAYAVQRGVTEASGYEVAGFKIGATAQVAMDLLGVSGPFFGPLYREAFQENDATVSLPMAHTPGIEAEFAVGLAADLPRRTDAWTRDEVEAAVAWVGPAFEIVGTRLEGGLPGKGTLAIADGGANVDFVCGPSGADWRSADLTAHPVALRVNGIEVASGHSGMLVFGDPVAGVLWLANHPELDARGLKAGDVVTTGTCTGITPLSPGDEAEADYGALGVVRARFSG